MSGTRALVSVAVALAALAAGCGGAAPAAPAAPTGGTPPVAAVRSGPLVLDERANGRTLQATPGQAISLVLHGSYWDNLRSTAPAVVSPHGRTSRSPGTCAPGVGCGTFRTAFVAERPGRAQLLADQTSCGEATACAPDQRHLAITIVVVTG
jgi:hypothetical protein